MKRLAIIASLVTFLSPNYLYADNSYFDLELERLMEIEITSVSRKSERQRDVAAAVFVITGEDIRRLGFTSIPEALRMVPGVQVARMDSKTWSISARGFGHQYGAKLLVLIDGRSVYTPVFSGVYWDVQDVLLEDVDRIEVIRGPGATVWGSNAVNGVINIITKQAKHTQGVYASARYGNVEVGAGEARYGGQIGQNTYYRLYAKHSGQSAFDTQAGTDNHDAWNRSQSGFRIEWERDALASLTVQGDGYYGTSDADYLYPSTTSPFTTVASHSDTVAGGNIIVKWEDKISDDSHISLQAYVDQARRNEDLLDQVVSTYDLEFRHIYHVNDRNEFVWGVGYRHIEDDLEGRAGFVDFVPETADYNLWNGFIQHEYQVVPEKVSLIAGTKIEHNDYTGIEFQPTVKAKWTPSDKQTVWWSVSRAVRIPSRVSDALTVKPTGFGPNTVFAGSPGGYSEFTGNPSLNGEKLVAYEMGYRVSPTEATSIDIAAYYNVYDELLTLEPGTPFMRGANLIYPLTFQNKASGTAYGVEVAASAQILENWTVSGTYTYGKIDIDLDPDSNDTQQVNRAGNSPQHQFTLRSVTNLTDTVEMDNAVYFVDDLDVKGFSTTTMSVPQYLRFDTRIGWEVADGIMVDVTGQNLFDDRHTEFAAPFYGRVTEVGRSVFGRVTVRY